MAQLASGVGGDRQALAHPLLAGGSRLRFDPDQTLFNEGDKARFVYIVVRGAVRLSKIRSNRRRQIVAFVLAGEMFGFEAGARHTLTAEALGKVVVVRALRRQAERLSEESADMRRQMMRLLAYGLSATRGHLVMLGRGTARERVASFLYLFARRNGIGNGGALDLPMNRHDIADYLGLTLETVCRALTELKRAGVIAMSSPRRLTIGNMAMLARLASGDEDEAQKLAECLSTPDAAIQST